MYWGVYAALLVYVIVIFLSFIIGKRGAGIEEK